MADGLLFEKRPSSGNAVGSAVLSSLFLLVIGIQGFHVVEHIVLVIQVSALGMSLVEAHGLLGARVDFEWLHFSYNSAFLVAEHIIRIVQYLHSGCTPCVGLIGQVVPFIWPHLFFGLFAYIPFVVCYFAFGLHRQLGLPFLAERAHLVLPGPPTAAPGSRVPSLRPFSAPGLDPQAIPRFTILERQDSDG